MGWRSTVAAATTGLLVAVGTPVALAHARADDPVTTTALTSTSTAATPTTTTATTIAPTPTVLPATRCAVGTAAQAAVDVATAAVAVLDTTTGTYTSAGDDTAAFNTASVVKVLLATQLLLTGQMAGTTADTAQEMVTASDDAAADALYEQAGGDDVVTLVGDHDGIDVGSPPADAGPWGETTVTASGLAHLYAALHADPVVWPWLSAAMGAATQTAADGTDQYFGIPSAARSWAVKQGWMVGLGPGATYDSTGFVDDGRSVVVLLSTGAASRYGTRMAATITAVAQALIPDGIAPGTAC